MKDYPIMMFLFFNIFCIIGCNNATEPEPLRPDPPEIIPKSSDEAAIETGIDAIPDGTGIFLQWSLPKNNLIKWIKIYRKSAKDNNFLFLSSESSIDTFFVDYEVYHGLLYSYYLIAVNRDRVESLPSDTVSYSLFPKPDNLNQSAGPKPVLSWHYSYIPPVGYLIRLEDYDSGELVWLSTVGQVYESIISATYNWDGGAVLDSLSTGVRFRWRVDVLGSDLYSGSESNWKLLERN